MSNSLDEMFAAINRVFNMTPEQRWAERPKPSDKPNNFIVPEREMIVQQLLLNNASPTREAAEAMIDKAKAIIDRTLDAFNQALYDATPMPDAEANPLQLQLLASSFLKHEGDSILYGSLELLSKLGHNFGVINAADIRKGE